MELLQDGTMESMRMRLSLLFALSAVLIISGPARAEKQEVWGSERGALTLALLNPDQQNKELKKSRKAVKKTRKESEKSLDTKEQKQLKKIRKANRKLVKKSGKQLKKQKKEVRKTRRAHGLKPYKEKKKEYEKYIPR